MSRSVLVPLSCCACSSSSRCSGRSQTEGRPLCPNWREPTNSALRRRRRIPFGSSEDFAALSQPSVSPRRPSLSRLQVQLARIMLRILDARGRERSKKGTKPSGTKRQFAQQQQKNMAALALLLTSFAALSLSLFLSLFPPSLFPLSFLSLSSLFPPSLPPLSLPAPSLSRRLHKTFTKGQNDAQVEAPPRSLLSPPPPPPLPPRLHRPRPLPRPAPFLPPSPADGQPGLHRRHQQPQHGSLPRRRDQAALHRELAERRDLRAALELGGREARDGRLLRRRQVVCRVGVRVRPRGPGPAGGCRGAGCCPRRRGQAGDGEFVMVGGDVFLLLLLFRKKKTEKGLTFLSLDFFLQGKKTLSLPLFPGFCVRERGPRRAPGKHLRRGSGLQGPHFFAVSLSSRDPCLCPRRLCFCRGWAAGLV